MTGETTLRRFLAPAGVPIPIPLLIRAWKASRAVAGGKDSLAAFARLLNVRYAMGASSGRAALWLALKTLHTLRPTRTVVAVPAYTCFSVPASVVRTGLKLHPLDIHPETLDFDYEEMENLPDRELLCIVTANLFGFVNNLARVRQIAQAKGAFVVDDAAQALGACRDGEPAGTSGDVGLFSLARGKVLPAGEGGLLVTNQEPLAFALQQAAEALPAPSLSHTAALFFRVLLSSVFLDPRLYWIPNLLPFLKLGVTEFEPLFPALGLPRLSAALLVELMSALDELNQGRIRNARAVADAVLGHGDYWVPRAAASCRPTYIRLPILAKDESTRNRAVEALRKAGIGASAFYPHAICDIEGIRQHMAGADFHRPQAEDLARRIFTLPTHRFVGRDDLNRMISILCSW